MKKAKHTPGPWHRDGQVLGMPYTVHVNQTLDEMGPSNGKVATAENIDGTFETRVANARLIAAAPDLLATIKELIDLEGPLPGNVAWFNKAVAAVARAEGRS